jgi:hypothetical protein
VHRGPWGKRLFYNGFDAAIELRGLELAPEHRHSLTPGELQQLGWDLLSLGDEDAGQVEPEEAGERLPSLFRRQRVQVGDLGFAEHMQPVGRKAAGIASQREPRPGHFRLRHLPIQAELAGEGLELKRVAPAGEKVAQSKHQTGLLD